MPESTVRTLDKGLAVIIERLANMQTDVNTKHAQNRSSIHDLNGKFERLSNEIWLLKVKIAAYASVAGVITAVFVKLVDHFFK